MTDESTFTWEDVKEPGDLDRLDKDGLVAFLSKYPDHEQKVELWNAWRDESIERIDLSGVKMEDVILSDVDLTRANLSGAIISQSDLSYAHLPWVDFSNAFITQTDLTNTVLAEANLTSSRLVQTDLSGAELRGANLTDTRYKQANLSGAELDLANLSDAQLWDTNLSGSSLRWANLSGAKLAGANLTGADLRRVHLRGQALSEVGSLQGVRLYRTYFWGVLSLRYEQFKGDKAGRSTIWEDTEGRFYEAKDIYKTLKGYFEDAGDYEGANWAYVREQVMEKLMFTRAMPSFSKPLLRLFYPRWRDKFDSLAEGEEQGPTKRPFLNWLRLEASEKIAYYGTKLWIPFSWLLAVLIVFAAVYWLGGMVTYIDVSTGAAYPLYNNFLNTLLFSAASMVTIDVGFLQPTAPYVGALQTLQAFFGIALTGLIGFVLGNKLRYS
jgi:uncharacterized protein YjbI with pentapeptide repeats